MPAYSLACDNVAYYYYCLQGPIISVSKSIKIDKITKQTNRLSHSQYY